MKHRFGIWFYFDQVDREMENKGSSQIADIYVWLEIFIVLLWLNFLTANSWKAEQSVVEQEGLPSAECIDF